MQRKLGVKGHTINSHMPRWILALCLLLVFACKKDNDSDKEKLPSALSAVYNDSTNCDPCHPYIELVFFNATKYYVVKFRPWALCDLFVARVYYDKKGNPVEFNSPTYNNLVEHGITGDLVWECKS